MGEQAKKGMPSAARVRAGARRPALIRFTLFFLAASVLAYGLEHYAQVSIAGGDQLSPASQSVFDARQIYQYLVTAWPRRLVPRYTVLVPIDPKRDPGAPVSLFNLCEQREMLARLIAAIANHDPAVIVIDKYFTDAGCRADHPNTLALQSAISKASVRVPIVVGLRIDKQKPTVNHGTGVAWQIDRPTLFHDAPLLREGIVNLDVDLRRLALGWNVVRDGNTVQWQNALAVEAAQAYDSRLLTKYPPLEDMLRKRRSPYLSMIPAKEFVACPAGDILLGKSCAEPAQSHCASRAGPSACPSYLRGKIVFVGEVSDDLDRHAAVIGNVSGMLLQANYTEALLDERYFAPTPWWVDYLVGFAFFVAIELTLRQRSAGRCLAGVVAVIAMTFLLLSLTVRHLGYYLNPVTVSAFILAIKLIHWLAERITKRGEVHHDK